MKRFWRFAKTTFLQFQADQCTHLAAAISYYAIFSLFPLLLGLIAIGAIFLQSPSLQATIVERVASYLPGSGDLISHTVAEVIKERGTLGLISIAGFVWSATGVFAAIRLALNVAWGAPHARPFVRGKVFDLVLVGTVGVLVVLSLALTSFLRIAETVEVPLLGLRPFHANPLWDAVQAIAPLIFSTLGFALVYRFV